MAEAVAVALENPDLSLPETIVATPEAAQAAPVGRQPPFLELILEILEFLPEAAAVLVVVQDLQLPLLRLVVEAEEVGQETAPRTALLTRGVEAVADKTSPAATAAPASSS